jgi:hypothetical protein
MPLTPREAESHELLEAALARGFIALDNGRIRSAVVPKLTGCASSRTRG